MPDAAKTGVIFLVLGFAVYLAWKDQLAAYLSFATKSASPAPATPTPGSAASVAGLTPTESAISLAGQAAAAGYNY